MESPIEPIVTFALRTTGAYTPESDLFEQVDRWRPTLAANENLEGTVTIQGGLEDVLIEDDLPATIQNLCLRAAPELLAGREARMLYFSCAGEMLLTPEGVDVRISGDFLDVDVVLPRLGLVRGLVACARRFIQLLRRLDNPRHVGLIEVLQAQLDTADAALLAAG